MSITPSTRPRTIRRGGLRWSWAGRTSPRSRRRSAAWRSGRRRRWAGTSPSPSSAAWTVVFFLLIGYLIATGIGVWGNNSPVAWAFDITNFVFWIGIGHAGTLISAILFLFRQKWRTSINRAAEAMTIFAVICAGIFPAIHVGRVGSSTGCPPIPTRCRIWPNFRSPLLWDVFAVGTYSTVSLMFWYLGMIPDLATLRDRAATRLRQVALRGLRPGLARARPGNGTFTSGRICCWPHWPRRWC